MKQSLQGPRAVLRKRQQGVSLIEILVSILIMSFGVLALAALIGNASRYNKTTEFRSIATLLAADIGDRMRANPAGAMADQYNLKNDYAELDEAPEVPDCADPANCTPAEIADRDMAEWRGNLFRLLPGGNAYVDRDSASNAVNVWIAWKDPGSSSDVDRPEGECPGGYASGDDAGSGEEAEAEAPPRCSYFRIEL
ncbi:type IV pilus modification protein PilV [Eleftheria terrae]|uniref:type IV pilus modification protein PilV n=1 Tax=Eleftheria terrae TaxID=1597781 RepID=UPI00263B8D3E|nr:type IV pilus modification protein PilV [Eleftheria terrae]WKB52418.1 type IV pilus modification protein PilV [Eleftheria terrae]